MGSSDSDHPTLQPRQSKPSGSIRLKITLSDVFKKWGPLLASVITGVVSAYGFVKQELDRRIESAVEEHNEDRANVAHGALRKRLDACEGTVKMQQTSLDQHSANLKTLYDALYEMYWFRVGEKAVELESDPRLRARLRSLAQERFERLVHDGESLDDAYRRALSTAAGLP